MIPTWVNKTDPKKHPTRYLASVWQTGLSKNHQVGSTDLLPHQYGQLKKLKQTLGEFTQHVVEWLLKPENWWHFSQQVKKEWKLGSVPDNPHIGFLLKYCNRALRITRWALHNSKAPADILLVQKYDQMRFEQMKALLLVLADGNPETISKTQAAKTLCEIQKVFIEMDTTAGSAS